MSGDTYSVRVAPFLLLPDHPLYHVDGVFNAIFVHGNMLGDGMFYGSGAGKLPHGQRCGGGYGGYGKGISTRIFTCAGIRRR